LRAGGAGMTESGVTHRVAGSHIARIGCEYALGAKWAYINETTH